MILDLAHFLNTERPYWQELETQLERLARDPQRQMTVADISRLYYLYQRASADLVKLKTFAAENELKAYLEHLVAQAYGEIHGGRVQHQKFNPFRWFWVTFPQAFRRNSKAFKLALLTTLVGAGFGMGTLMVAPDQKEVILPFSHLLGDPKDRVAEEESKAGENMARGKSVFSARLMTHNTRVAIFSMALGLTFGLGTLIILFYNGVILGMVCLDYVLAGESVFLAGWLLPHGIIEIPAILVGGQAGFLLASALIGWGTREPMRVRMRQIVPDLVTLVVGAGCMLVWAGVVEAFLSQYHEPVVPYAAKIGFGLVEFALLVGYLNFAGRPKKDGDPVVPGESRVIAT